ncbi:unnamed protein product [Effrenium voratum]|nr:unnamed protein product [Effrenium voratum]
MGLSYWPLSFGCPMDEPVLLSAAEASNLAGQSIHTEDDVLHTPELPNFEAKLSQADSELLLSFLTVPYLRVPLLLQFFNDRSRFAALCCPRLQAMLDAVLFEPGPFEEENESAQCPEVVYPGLSGSEGQKLLATPAGRFVHELVHSPTPVLAELDGIFRLAMERDVPQYTSASSAVLYAVRLWTRVGIWCFALFGRLSCLRPRLTPADHFETSPTQSHATPSGATSSAFAPNPELVAMSVSLDGFGRFINVFWSDVGVTRTEIGMLSLAQMVASFLGQLFWSLATDRLGEYKRVLVGTSLAGTAIIFFNLVPAVQTNFWLLSLVCVSSSFFLSTGGPIIDAMCLSVLKEQESEEQYGDQRLWCAVGWGGMSLVAGQLIDTFGIGFMFWGFASIQAVYLGIILYYMPMRKNKQEASQEMASIRQFLNFDVLWFFANLVVYGLAMSVVESFLLVFLNEDFENCPKVLLGASTAVMCFFEIPVFKYVENVWASNKDRLTSVLMACKVVLAFRCLCYTVIPASNPWLVLLVEPLHGFTFAAMWSATVEYGQRIAPPGCVARMQALVNGIYYQIAMGIGTAMWGPLVMDPPAGLGFRNCFRVDAAGIVLWGLIWQSGLMLRHRSRIAREAAVSEQPLTDRA